MGTIRGKTSTFVIIDEDAMNTVKVTMGFKGNSVLDAGYIYAPYVPLMSTSKAFPQSILDLYDAVLPTFNANEIIKFISGGVSIRDPKIIGFVATDENDKFIKEGVNEPDANVYIWMTFVEGTLEDGFDIPTRYHIITDGDIYFSTKPLKLTDRDQNILKEEINKLSEIKDV